MKHATQLLLDISSKPNYSKEDFVESPCNWEASQWVQRWPDWPMKMIAIYGEPGCGKTHLAHIWQQRSKARFLKPTDTLNLKPHEVIENVQAFVLDDADTTLTREGHVRGIEDEWLFHFYNLVREKGADLLICCRQPPTQWTITLPDLRSRLSTILSVAVNPPDEEALIAVLLKLCSERGMILSREIADYIVRRIERSFESIRNIVNALDHETLTQHRQLTLGLVKNVLNQPKESN